MNISTSECSSGCESGWTMYLDQSSNSADQCDRVGFPINDEDCRSKGENVVEEEEEEDEDLSMVSDASSGPPQFHENGDFFYDTSSHFCFASSTSEQANKRKQKTRIKNGVKQQNSYLDDTASSPFLSFSKNIDLSNNEASMRGVQGVSQDSSATHSKGKSALKKHFGFLKSSGPGKEVSGKSGGLQGRKWQ
ncbi:unnamed protein product [Ilex paraguariensis]|uniref:Uncharacterized protein n=1 Tax=Ilex paraguariensis TaxID=185542 RepID=A0ABC8SF31_9AQUA